MQPLSHIRDDTDRLDVTRMANELCETLRGLHSEVRVEASPVDLIAEFRGVMFCRIVRYRELLHLQAGQDPMWECRLRRTDELPEVKARIVRAFLFRFAHTPARQ